MEGPPGFPKAEYQNTCSANEFNEIEASPEDTIAEDGISPSPDNSQPFLVEEDLEHEIKESASMIEDSSIDFGSPRESSALEGFLAAKPIKTDPDANNLDSVDNLFPNREDGGEENTGQSLTGTGSNPSVVSDQELPDNSQCQVDRWVQRRGATAIPPFATHEPTGWPEGKFVDSEGRDLQTLLFPCHVAPRVYVVVHGQDLEPTFTRFRNVAGARFNPPGYWLWLGDEGWEKEPSISRLKGAGISMQPCKALYPSRPILDALLNFTYSA